LDETETPSSCLIGGKTVREHHWFQRFHWIYWFQRFYWSYWFQRFYWSYWFQRFYWSYWFQRFYWLPLLRTSSSSSLKAASVLS